MENEKITVLKHTAENFSLIIHTIEAEKMEENHYHLIAPNGQLTGTLGKYRGSWEFHNIKESERDKLELQIPEKVAKDFIEEVETVEPQ